MSRRRRWQPVRGYGNRVYRGSERWLLRLVDLPSLLLRRRMKAAEGAPPLDPRAVRRVLVLRLDRVGDLVMSLPALADLRAALPAAHITLAVGSWSAAIARRAPIDEVVVWSAPWVGRRAEGAETTSSLFRRARSFGRGGLDLAIDLQGDIRAAHLMALTRARARVGYVNTGGGWLLTHVVPLDEGVSWVEQNRRAVRTALALGETPPAGFPPLLTESERALGRRILDAAGAARRPLIGIHPSGGRRIKEWPIERWCAVAERLVRERGASIIVTGSETDRALGAALSRAVGARGVDLCGQLRLEETLAVIAELDLLLSADTGPMHLAVALGTPSVSLFGPSDPVRYFSGEPGPRHAVVRADLWCSPCNLIRKPPTECARPPAPECLALLSPSRVFEAAVGALDGLEAAAPRGSRARPDAGPDARPRDPG